MFLFPNLGVKENYGNFMQQYPLLYILIEIS